MDINKISKVSELLEQFQKKNKPSELLESLNLLLKLLLNIVSNPNEEKYRTIKKTNATLKAKLFNISNMDEIFKTLDFNLIEGNYIYLNSNTFDIQSILPLLRNTIDDLNSLSLTPEEYERRQEIKKRQKELNEKYQKEREQAENLKRLAEYDRKEKSQEEKPQCSIGNDLKFGANAKGFKDIGIDVNKQRRG